MDNIRICLDGLTITPKNMIVQYVKQIDAFIYICIEENGMIFTFLVSEMSARTKKCLSEDNGISYYNVQQDIIN